MWSYLQRPGCTPAPGSSLNGIKTTMHTTDVLTCRQRSGGH